MKKREKMLFAAALCAMALFAGCASAHAVSLEEAQRIALNSAGVADAVFTERHLDPEDGVYEISFLAGGVAYEFEVDAKTGAIRSAEAETLP